VEATASSVRAGAPWIIGVLLALTVAATFVPWLQTGETRRDSYAVARSATQLDVVDGAAATAARRVWPFVPFLGCLSLLALVLDRIRLGTALAAAVGVLVVLFAVTVSNAPRNLAWGATAGLVLGLALLATTAVTASTGPGPARREP